MHKMVLDTGLGNRLNKIVQALWSGEELDAVWVVNRHCPARWGDMFSNPEPFRFRCISSHARVKRRFQRYKAFIMVRPRCWSEFGVFARRFFLGLEPSREVLDLMPEIPPGTVGWHLRLLHPHSRCRKFMDVPPGVFLASDCLKQLDRCRDRTIQVRQRRHSFRDQKNRDMQAAAAAWFCFFECCAIAQPCMRFGGLAGYHSTFLDAHRIMGIPVVDGFGLEQ